MVVAIAFAAPEPKAAPKPGVLAYSAPLVTSAVYERTFHGNLAPFAAAPYVASPYAAPYAAAPYVASPYVASPYVASPYAAAYSAPLVL